MGSAKLGMERSIEMPNAASVEASDSPKNPEYFRTARMPILATTAAKTIRRFFRLQASRISRLPELAVASCRFFSARLAPIMRAHAYTTAVDRATNAISAPLSAKKKP